MKLNKKDLKKISLDFLSLSNRLIQADFRDYSTVLSRFTRFIRDIDIINDYIVDCGPCEMNLEQAFQKVQSSRYIFDFGNTNEEEIRNISAILNYIVDNNIDVAYQLGLSYSSSTHFQDHVKAFNERVVMILINHIENYLTKIGIDMGVDEKINYNITVHNGQINIANDNAVINANSIISSTQVEQMYGLISDISKAAKKSNLSTEDEEILESNLEVIEEEIKKEKPRKGFIKAAIAGLKGIKGTAEFAAAVTALAEFILPLIG